MVGGVTTAYGNKTVAPAAAQFKAKEVPEVIALLFTEKYGPKSFFRLYVRGMLTTINCKASSINHFMQVWTFPDKHL